eukprot:2049965-Ditylum_brightwellii.AAC.1
MQLFTSVDVDPNNVYYFCTHKSNKDKATLWLDKLPARLRSMFDHDTLCAIGEDDDDPFRSYRDAAAENTDNAVNGFDELLCGVMETELDEEQKEQPEIEEDHL